MKRIKRTLISAGIMTILAVIAVATALFAGCSGAVESETYTTQSCYIEEAYRGDCWNGVSNTLTLNGDGTYVLVENTSIIQQSGVVVTYWTYTIKGTWEETAADETSKTVTLSAATSVTYNMNGTVSTDIDNASLLDYNLAKGGSVVCDLETLKYEAA